MSSAGQRTGPILCRVTVLKGKLQLPTYSHENLNCHMRALLLIQIQECWLLIRGLNYFLVAQILGTERLSLALDVPNFRMFRFQPKWVGIRSFINSLWHHFEAWTHMNVHSDVFYLSPRPTKHYP